MSADAGSQSGKERRTHLRVPLDVPCFVTLRRDDGTDIPALMVDFGCGGIQAALPPGSAEDFHAWLSHQVVVLGLPVPSRCGDSGHSGTVSWVSAERCGVRFQSPLSLSDEELETIVNSF